MKFETALKRLSEVNSFAGLGQLAEALRAESDLKIRALLSYVEQYPPLNGEKFYPNKFISEDLSGIMLGQCPVIFLGTNDWAIKRYRDIDKEKKEIAKWCCLLKRLLPEIKIPAHCLIVPEKDHLIRSHLAPFSAEGAGELALEELVSVCRDHHVPLTCPSDFDVSSRFNVADYTYYDTHLTTHDYLTVFLKILKDFGLEKSFDIDRIELKNISFVGDLAKNLCKDSLADLFLVPEVRDSTVKQVGGDPGFNSPFRNTYQEFACPGGIPAKLVIYGDSHSNIYKTYKLTYLFANVFERCSFYWDPYCMSGRQIDPDADFVLFEVSQRFVY